MPDLNFDDFRQVPVQPVPAAEVRRRGEQRQRRARSLYAVGGAAVVAAIVAPLAVLAGHADRATDPVRPAGQPPSASSTAGASTIPRDFPLDAGADTGAGLTETGPSAKAPGVRTSDECALRLWPNENIAASDRLAVTIAGEAHSDARELRLYDDTATAGRAWRSIQEAAADGCTSETGFTWRRLDADTGYDSITMAKASADGRPDGAIYQFTRVGPAILAVGYEAEYQLGSLPADGARATAATEAVAPSLCVFATTGCGDPSGAASSSSARTALGPDGYGDLRIGESSADALASGLLVKAHAGTAWSGGYVLADHSHSLVCTSPGDRVTAISSGSAPGDSLRTPAGIGVGSTLAELRAAYPSAHEVNYSGGGHSGIYEVPLGGHLSYEIDVETNQLVTDVILEDDRQACFE